MRATDAEQQITQEQKSALYTPQLVEKLAKQYGYAEDWEASKDNQPMRQQISKMIKDLDYSFVKRSKDG